MRLILDCGHGGVWPKGDPGVVWNEKVESYYTFQYGLTLKKVLEAAGYEVVMTRDQDVYSAKDRTSGTRPEDLFISLHFDTYQGGKKLIYYAALNGPEASQELARTLDRHLGTNDLRPSTSSRFGRLYLDDAKCPAVLIEIDRIDLADDSEDAKLAFSKKVLAGLRDFQLGWNRVFLVTDFGIKQLGFSKATVAGDKLYLRLNETLIQDS